MKRLRPGCGGNDHNNDDDDDNKKDLQADFLPAREARSIAARSPFDNLTETLPSVVRNDSKK